MRRPFNFSLVLFLSHSNLLKTHILVPSFKFKSYTKTARVSRDNLTNSNFSAKKGVLKSNVVVGQSSKKELRENTLTYKL